MRPAHWVRGALILGAVVFAALLLVQYVSERVEDRVRNVVTDWYRNEAGDVEIVAEQIAEDLRVARTINSEDSKLLRSEVKRLSEQNEALKEELARLNGEVSSFTESVGDIVINSGDTTSVPESGDFSHRFQDAWIDAVVEKRGRELTFNYITTMRLEEFDVETLLPGGIKTHLFNTALISTTTGDTLNIPVRRTTYEVTLPKSGFAYSPRLHLRAGGGLGSAWGGVGCSLFSYGADRYIETTKFFLLEGVALAADGGVGVGVMPVSWNIGRPMPFVNNVSIGVGYVWGEENSGAVLLIGAAL